MQGIAYNKVFIFILGSIMTQKIKATDITEQEAANAVFFERADQFIQIANEFCSPAKGSIPQPEDHRGQVSAAMLFATARFNTWVAANNFKSGEEMQAAKDQIMSYLMQQFQMMLEDNFDEYCEQFETYLRFRKNEEFHTHKHDH